MADALLSETIAAEIAPPIDFAAPDQPPLKVREKALYAAGDMVDGTVAYAIAAYLFYYLTADCGLSGSLASGALAISIVVDAVMDPAIGFISDNTRSRWGRRHPYMLLSAIPTAAALGLARAARTGRFVRSWRHKRRQDGTGLTHVSAGMGAHVCLHVAGRARPPCLAGPGVNRRHVDLTGPAPSPGA